MGEMVMKKLFDKSGFLFSSFDKEQKRQSTFVSLLLLVLFVLAGIGLVVYYVVIKKDEVPTEATISSFKTAFTLIKAL